MRRGEDVHIYPESTSSTRAVERSGTAARYAPEEPGMGNGLFFHASCGRCSEGCDPDLAAVCSADLRSDPRVRRIRALN